MCKKWHFLSFAVVRNSKGNSTSTSKPSGLCFITSSFLWKWTKKVFSYQCISGHELLVFSLAFFTGIFLFSVQRDTHLFSVIYSYSVCFLFFRPNRLTKRLLVTWLKKKEEEEGLYVFELEIFCSLKCCLGYTRLRFW